MRPLIRALRFPRRSVATYSYLTLLVFSVAGLAFVSLIVFRIIFFPAAKFWLVVFLHLSVDVLSLIYLALSSSFSSNSH
jgi:hypothetical protein